MNLCEFCKTQYRNIETQIGNQSRAKQKLDPSPVSSHSHTQAKSSRLGACNHSLPCSRGKSVQVCWYRCVSSQHTGTNITAGPCSLFSHRHNQSPAVALQVTTCPAPEVQAFKSPLQMNIVLPESQGFVSAK